MASGAVDQLVPPHTLGCKFSKQADEVRDVGLYYNKTRLVR